MKNMKKLLALLLAATTTFSLAACGSKTATEGGKSNSESATESGADTLVAVSSGFEAKFSPFFAQNVDDRNVGETFTQLGLLQVDRVGNPVLKGIEGETREYNGTDYTYYGTSDITVTENEDGTVTYDVQMRDDLTFSDGEKATIDDVIFGLYVFADPTYDGSTTIYSCPIQGMEEYRGGMSTLSVLLAAAGEDNTDFSLWTEEQQKAFWDAVNDGGVKFAQEIVDY
ncbi:MAG: ABC transporter substrate-binding protein, partial [Lachnospiraceae bacterium]|nr:ABC transporter substrate-binding protein [Lachnospiraceae bacterium]